MELIFITLLVVGSWYLVSKWRSGRKEKKLTKKYIHPNYPDFEHSELQEMTIAGAHHYKYSKSLKASDKLLMVRDPKNEFDMDAIKFFTLYGKHVGFVPASQNKDFATAMDNGQKFFGQVRKIQKNEDYKEILVKIYKVD